MILANSWAVVWNARNESQLGNKPTAPVVLLKIYGKLTNQNLLSVATCNVFGNKVKTVFHKNNTWAQVAKAENIINTPYASLLK